MPEILWTEKKSGSESPDIINIIHTKISSDRGGSLPSRDPVWLLLRPLIGRHRKPTVQEWERG